MLDKKVRNKRAVIVMCIGLACNVVLFGVKLYIGLAISSISIVTDAINNLGDIVTCALSVFCFALMQKNKRSEKYPYGYGRLESIISFFMAILIIAVGVYFFISALNRFMLATLLVFKWKYVGILMGTVLVKAGMAVFYRVENKKLNSDIIKSAFFDSVLDTSITAMTVIGVLLARYVQLRIDAVFGTVVSVITIIGGVKLFIEGIRTLLGRKLPEQVKDKLILEIKGIEGIEEIKSVDYHDYGSDYREVIVKAVFTKDVNDDIINNAINKVKIIENENGFKISLAISDAVGDKNDW